MKQVNVITGKIKMRALRFFAMAAAMVAISVALPAQAGTIIGGSAQPTAAVLSGASPQAIVKYSFQIKYFNNEKIACGARLDYGDGRPAEMVPIQIPMTVLSRDVAYTAVGAYKLTLSGTAFGGMVACLGASTANANVSVPIGQVAAGLKSGVGTLQPIGGPASAPLGDALKGIGVISPSSPTAGLSQAQQTVLATAPNAVSLGFTLDASVFPFGVRQGFTVTGSTAGAMCHFMVEVTSDHVVYNEKFAAPLPWKSPDLKLPPLADTKMYSVKVTPLSPSQGNYTGLNFCKDGGWGAQSFQVISQMGALMGIDLSVAVVAVNQKVDFTVVGKIYGDCQFNLSVGRKGRPLPAPLNRSGLPFKYDTSFAEAGQYYAYAEQILREGKPLGCTGQVASSTLTVIDRPACPSPQYAYSSGDDSEYGCRYPSTVQYAAPQALACPTFYTSFHTGGSEVAYGCRRDGVNISAMAQPGGNVSSASGFTTNAPGDAPAKPALQKIQMVAVNGGSIPRPNNSIVYTGEALRLDISGNLPNNAGYGNQCGYTVALENTATHVTKDYNFDTFDIHAFGAAPIAGAYSVKATPHPHGNVPGCQGEASASITIHPAAAWLTGLKLTAFGAHFGIGSDGMYPEFCENCDSIFSPAHNSALMDTAPTITAGPSCAYEIVQNGKVTPEVYTSGGAVPPAYPATRVGPWRGKWGNNDTITVTVRGFAGLFPLPACNGSITKSVKLSDDPNKAPVIVQ